MSKMLHVGDVHEHTLQQRIKPVHKTCSKRTKGCQSMVSFVISKLAFIDMEHNLADFKELADKVV